MTGNLSADIHLDNDLHFSEVDSPLALIRDIVSHDMSKHLQHVKTKDPTVKNDISEHPSQTAPIRRQLNIQPESKIIPDVREIARRAIRHDFVKIHWALKEYFDGFSSTECKLEQIPRTLCKQT